MKTTEYDQEATAFLDLILDVMHGTHIGLIAEEIPDDFSKAVAYTNADPIVTDQHGFIPEPTDFLAYDDHELRVVFGDDSALSFLFDEEGYSYALRVLVRGRIVADF
jgi:hypothetical protein